jgi:hypothetical protein
MTTVIRLRLRLAALGLLTAAGIALDAPIWTAAVTGTACVALPIAVAARHGRPALRALFALPSRPGRQPFTAITEEPVRP